MYVYKSTSRKTDIILVIISMLFSQISNSLKKKKKKFGSLNFKHIFWITAKNHCKFKE